jgi:hypothetical protein
MNSWMLLFLFRACLVTLSVSASPEVARITSDSSGLPGLEVSGAPLVPEDRDGGVYVRVSGRVRAPQATLGYTISNRHHVLKPTGAGDFDFELQLTATDTGFRIFMLKPDGEMVTAAFTARLPGFEKRQNLAAQKGVEADFSGLRNRERGSIGFSYGTSAFGYVGTNSLFENTFSAGMSGPYFYGSLPLGGRLGLEASWLRMDFNVYQQNVRYESILLGGSYDSGAFSGPGQLALKFVGTAHLGFNSLPEVLAISATQVRTSQLNQWVVDLGVKLLHPLDESFSLFFGAQACWPLSSSSASLGVARSAALNIFPIVSGGASLRVGKRWTLTAEVSGVFLNLRYAAAGDSLQLAMTGYRALGGVYFGF